MIQYASSRHPNVTLVTNATLLDERMARAILATPLQKIRFSVDGLTRETFEKIRIQLPSNEFVRKGTDVGYNAVMTNIERFLPSPPANGQHHTQRRHPNDQFQADLRRNRRLPGALGHEGRLRRRGDAVLVDG